MFCVCKVIWLSQFVYLAILAVIGEITLKSARMFYVFLCSLSLLLPNARLYGECCKRLSLKFLVWFHMHIDLGPKHFLWINKLPGFFLNKEMEKARSFGCISVPSGMELISTELFLIKHRPLGGTSVCGLWMGTAKELSVPADGLRLMRGRNNFLTVLLQSKLHG